MELTPKSFATACVRHIPKGFTLRKRKPWDYFVLDERQCVAGLLHPVPLFPFPEANPNGVLDLSAYVAQLEGADPHYKAFVSVWHRKGASMCTMRADGTLQMPLQHFTAASLKDKLQHYKPNMLLQNGTSNSFLNDFFSTVATQFHDEINPCSKFIRVVSSDGTRLWGEVVQQYNTSHQEDCPLNFKDSRWVEARPSGGAAFSMLRNSEHGELIVLKDALVNFLHRGSLVMDRDYSSNSTSR